MDWLLLRGLARETRHWGDFVGSLARARPADRIHTLNLPGMGRQCHETSPASIAAIRRHLQGRSECLQPPLLIVGLSLGGMVALDWACDSPHAIAGVVAINSSCAWNPPWQRLRANRLRQVLKLLSTADIARREAGIMALTSNRSHPQALLQSWQSLQAEYPISGTNALRQIVAASRYRPHSEKPSPPVLFLASEADRLVSVQCSRTLAQRWQCPLRMHPWAGHDLPLDDPDWVIEQLVDFQETRCRTTQHGARDGEDRRSD